MKKSTATFHIGKNGLKENFIQTLKDAFNERENIKIIVLKSAGHIRKNVLEIAEKIQENLGKKYSFKIVGFTIFLKKWRRPKL